MLLNGISSHVSQQLTYVSQAGIPPAFGICDLQHVSPFGHVQDFSQALAFCALTGPRQQCFRSQPPHCSTDFISVIGACVSPALRGGSCLDCPDLQVIGSSLHLGAACQWCKLLDVSQTPNFQFATQLLNIFEQNDHFSYTDSYQYGSGNMSVVLRSYWHESIYDGLPC